MFKFFAEWREKSKCKREFARDLRELVARNAFDDLEGDYDTKARELEASYLKRGLTRQDIDDVKKHLGPVRIE